MEEDKGPSQSGKPASYDPIADRDGEGGEYEDEQQDNRIAMHSVGHLLEVRMEDQDAHRHENASETADE